MEAQRRTPMVGRGGNLSTLTTSALDVEESPAALCEVTVRDTLWLVCTPSAAKSTSWEEVVVCSAYATGEPLGRVRWSVGVM